MLTEQSKNQVSRILFSTPKLVENSLLTYESTVKKIGVDQLKKEYYALFNDLFREIALKIQRQEPISILEYQEKILLIFISLDLDYQFFVDFIGIYERLVFEFIFDLGNNEQLNQIFSAYFVLLKKSAEERDTFIKKNSTENLIRLISEYGPSVGTNTERVNSYDFSSDRKIYPLISSGFYWGEQIKNPSNQQKITIYKDKVYKLNTGIANPSTIFKNEEWEEIN